MNKILLINPPFYRFMGLEQDYIPLSLMAVQTWIEHNDMNWEAYIKNCEVGSNLSYEGYTERKENYNKYLEQENHPIWKELIQTIQEVRPSCLGITVLNAKLKSALYIIDNIAKQFDIPVIVGGPHPTMFPNIYNKKDVTPIVGEYESWGYNMPKGRVFDLDSLPLYNYDRLLDSYSPNGYAHIVTSRGCPYACNFCASKTIWGRKVTYKSIKRIISEMRYIYDRFRPTLFTIWDDIFTMNESRIKEFCSLYDIPVPWVCDTRADALTDEKVKMMVESGCKHISMGVESGVNRILKYINKGETTTDYIKAAHILNKYKVKWKAYVIIGFPQEDSEDMLQTLSFVKSLKPFRITLSYFTPYPGTELWTECLEKGLVSAEYDPTLYAHQSPNNYFTPRIKKEDFFLWRDIITKKIDEYNQEAIKEWR